MVAAVVGKMLKNPVTLGSISRVLLNLTKRLMFVMFQRLLVRLNVHAVNIYIFSFSPIAAASHLKFCSLAFWLVLVLVLVYLLS